MIRVFPRRTKWTPGDEGVYFGDPGLYTPAEEHIKISCVFTWDIPEAKRLQGSWGRHYKHVEIGGPAFNDPGGNFEPGVFIKKGVTITSRGCPNNCPWCFVPKREGKIRELPVRPGWIIQDNNLLACSRDHVGAVFDMLKSQPKPIKFSGGFETRRLDSWHVDLLKTIKLDEVWVACDRQKDIYYLERAADLLSDFSTNKKRCYVLIGHNGEDIKSAKTRLAHVFNLGFLPFAQLYQEDKKRNYNKQWRRLARYWSRPAAYRSAMTGGERIVGGE